MDISSATMPVIWMVLLRVALGLIWLRSGLMKVVSREYLEFRERFERFMSGNPFPWYRAFLERYMLPNSRPAGYFFVALEVCIGTAFVVGFLTVPAAVIAVFLNINFRLAAGWRSPSNTPLNYLMIICQILVILSDAGGYFSLDALLFSAGTGK
jgi:thiosulfate dehydrogenase [quinone] large subunit